MIAKIKVIHTGHLKKLPLTTAEYRNIGEVMLAAQKKRIASGINVQGSPAKPLSAKYAKIKAKVRHQRSPKRDMNLTGETMDSFEVLRAWGGVIKCGPRTASGQYKAFWADKLEPMFGFSPAEERAVNAYVRRIYGRKAQTLWQQTS